MFDGVIREAFFIVALLSGVPLCVSAVTGLLIGILQAATQVQEQSVGYLAKIIAVGAVLALCGPLFLAEAIRFLQELLMSIGSLGGEVRP